MFLYLISISDLAFAFFCIFDLHKKESGVAFSSFLTANSTHYQSAFSQHFRDCLITKQLMTYTLNYYLLKTSHNLPKNYHLLNLHRMHHDMQLKYGYQCLQVLKSE